MAIAATTYGQIWSTGSDNNGGGFDPGNANMATDGAATSATGSSPVFSSVSYNFVAGDVGAWVYIKSGTNWIPGWYQIASVASNKATLSAAANQAVLVGSLTVPFGPNAAAGCASTASPTGATWSIDYSQQAAAQFAYTDLVIDGTTNTKCTSAAHPFNVSQTGNIINVTGGTGFTVQRVQIVSVSGTTATVDKSLGTLSSTGGTGNLGGALASVNGTNFAIFPSQNVVWIKATATYSLSGTAISTGGFNTGQKWIIGYTSLMGDNGQATCDATGMTASNDTFSIGDHSTMANITVNNSKRDAFTSGNVQSRTVNCVASSASRFGFEQIRQGIGCKAVSCTTAGFDLVNGSVSSYTGCYAKSCAIGFQASATGAPSYLFGCVARANTNHGFSLAENVLCVHCVAHGNTNDGFHETDECSFINCISWGNGAFGFNGSSTGVAEHGWMQTCAAGSNTSGAVNNYFPVTVGTILVALTSDPCTNAASDDFTLNNTAGGGAACRAAGWPGLFASGAGTGHPDIGALQHLDAGGTTAPIVSPMIVRGTEQLEY